VRPHAASRRVRAPARRRGRRARRRWGPLGGRRRPSRGGAARAAPPGPRADDNARRAAARAAAQAWGQVVVLKGAKTVVAEPDGTVAVAPFENPALASGGTGDVLAGVIAGLLAQGLRPGPAARLGVYLHGTAGDMVRERLGDAGLLASDLPDAVPLVRKRLAAIAERGRSGKRVGFAVRDGGGATA
jgi:hypothetical protein